MDALHPVADLLFWARWLTAFACLIWLPGHVLIGRSVGQHDIVTRGVLEAGAGLLSAGLFAALKLPATPWVFVAFSLVAAVSGRAALKGTDLSAPSSESESGSRYGSLPYIAAIPDSYDRDQRFERVLRGRSSGLYRILWDREPTR